MADYVVVDKEQLEADLTTVADAIREKAGTIEPLEFPQGMASAVEAIQSGGSEEFVGIKYSDFVNGQPTIADMRGMQSYYDGLSSGLKNRFSINTAYSFCNFGRTASNGMFTSLETVYVIDGLFVIGTNMFYYCGKLKNIHGDLIDVEKINNNAFGFCSSLETIPYMPNLKIIGSGAFVNCTNLKEVKFYSIPPVANNFNGTMFNNCSNLLDIYVPWSEGEVANAPWGATNATIHYNTVYDENHNPIIQEV